MTAYANLGNHVYTDFDPMGRNLFQGSRPPKFTSLPFDVVVLCAEEYQPSSRELLVEKVIHCGFDDAPIKRDMIHSAVNGAIEAAPYVLRGKRVLITCFMGWNRSGLVTALMLHILTGASGKSCREHVQKNRDGALGNDSFVTFLDKVPRRC